MVDCSKVLFIGLFLLGKKNDLTNLRKRNLYVVQVFK